MKSRVLVRAATLFAVATLAFVVFGCSKKAGIHAIIPNLRPSVDITSAPVDTHDLAFYAYRINWSGDDPDGRVDHYAYAIDPGDRDTVWAATTKNEQTFFFRSLEPQLGGSGQVRSTSPHTFVIKAYDNLGTSSAPKARSFYSYTVAPTVTITSPPPNFFLYRQVTPSMRVTWTGSDPDGQFTQKPVKYKYKLFANGNSEFPFALILSSPDSLRRFYAATNFATWDSVGGDTTSVQYTGLTPDLQYVFVVIAYDEAGAYSPVFSLTTNMLKFEVGFAGTLGPIITVFNSALFYRMPSGGFTPGDPTTWVNFELAADQQVTFNWGAEPPPGALIQWYRWRVDGNVFDETPRTAEDTDWSHWSARSVGTTSCTIGPFTPGVARFLYIEALDNNGLLSIVTIVLHPVQPTFDHQLLIVDDTRLEEDMRPLGGTTMLYTKDWPSAAELDTFLYARGGYPWRETQVAANVVPQPISRPGLFAGYSFDTLGTRLGLPIASAGVPLSTLGKYKHIVWMVDNKGGTNLGTPIDPTKPMSTLHWMCTPNHMNTLGSYIASGGSVWLCGGDGALASLREFDAKGSDNNNGAYPGAGRTIFGSNKNELVPGRLMYDVAHWQSELACQSVNPNANTVVKSLNTPRQPWTSPGWRYGHPLVSADYSLLPATMRLKSLARGDTLPPTRTLATQTKFYSVANIDVEYMTQANRITEDNDPSPGNITEVSTLDTLMTVRGSDIASTGNENVAMTWYHGVSTPDFVFTGFSIWRWTRSDCQTIVDFVLRSIWKDVTFNPAARTVPPASARSTASLSARGRPAATSVGAGSRLPLTRTSGR